MNQKKLQAVRITWLDSAEVQGWTVVDELPKTRYKKIDTLGWLVREDKNMVVVAAHYGYQPDQVCGAMFIPVVSIVEIEMLDLEKTRGNKETHESEEETQEDTETAADNQG